MSKKAAAAEARAARKAKIKEGIQAIADEEKQKAPVAEDSPKSATKTKRGKAKAVEPEEDDIIGGEKGEINDRIRKLISKSKAQGYLTYKDINDELPETIDSANDIENVITILENLDIDIIDSEEVELYKQRLEEHNEEELRNAQADILDDPVRMYLKQMGQVPLLTREQEVAISKRIETAEQKAQNELFAVAFTKDFQKDLANRLLSRDERFDRVVLDKKN
ncbi:MAG: hypothetical protein LR015_07590 [Verrucomicrobia bacterium]|nr:hypothetical protein [Verrucomicrobiota bacterium]